MPLLPKISQAEILVLNEISTALNVDPDWLYSLIDFESAWRPNAINPYSGAAGLIQFTNTTARNMGYLSAADLVYKYPTRIMQLSGPVYEYLKRYAPYPTKQSLTMAVFYPAYRNVPPETPFPASVTKGNPGIKTVNDYIKRVFNDWVAPASIGGALLVLLFILYLTSQKGAS